MTRLSAARLAVLLALLVGMLGCDLSPPLQPLGTETSPSPTAPGSSSSSNPTASPTASPTPTPTPAITAIRGVVLDRNDQPLPGARVTVGSLSLLSAEASASATDEQGQAVTLSAGEFILLRVPAGDQTLKLSYDDATRSLPVTVAAEGVTRPNDLKLPVDGAVPSGSKALVATNGLALLKVQKASSSAPLVFTQESVILNFKAPPNGSGDQIGAFSLTYLQEGVPISPTVTRTVPKLSVSPALGATRSGPTTAGEFYILNTSASLQSAWTFDKPDATLKLQFYADEGGRAIVDRAGDPLVVRIPCLLVP